MTFTNFLDLFHRTANKLNISQEVKASHVCEIARRIIREDYPNIWNDCTVKSFQNGQLTLGALNSNSAQELFYIRAKLLQKTNKHFSSQLIKTIKIHIDLHKKESNYYS